MRSVKPFKNCFVCGKKDPIAWAHRKCWGDFIIKFNYYMVYDLEVPDHIPLEQEYNYWVLKYKEKK